MAGTVPAPPAAAGHPEPILQSLTGQVAGQDLIHITTHVRDHSYSTSHQHAFQRLRDRAANQDAHVQVSDLCNATWQVCRRQGGLLPLEILTGSGPDHEQASGRIEDR